MAFDFYFAGSQHKTSEQLIVDSNSNVLRSFVNDKGSIERFIKLKKDGAWKGKLLVDSGAFSVYRKGLKVNIDEYIDWLNIKSEYIDYFIMLDVIPGKYGLVKTSEDAMKSADLTWKNYLYMVDRLKEPLKLLPVFHQYKHADYLKQFLNYRINGQLIPYICLSGDKQKTGKFRKQWYAKCFDIIHKSDNPFIKVHCLGSATLTDVVYFPFTSMDSTTWIMCSANGSIMTPYGTVFVSDMGKFNKNNLVNLSTDWQNLIKTMCDRYNINYDKLFTDYKERAMFNVNYMIESSNEVKYKERNLKIRRLF